MLNPGRAIAQMRIGMNAVFTSFRTILRNISKNTASETNANDLSPKEAMVVNENDTSNQNLIRSISDKKVNDSCLTSGNGEISLVDDQYLTIIDAESSSENESTDNSSLIMFRAAFKDLMDEAKIQLIVDIKTMVEENRKEMKGLNEENKKETKTMIAEIKKEIKRLDENKKDLYKTVKKDHGVIKRETKDQKNKARGKTEGGNIRKT